MDLSIEEAMDELRMPHLAWSKDGTAFSIEWHATERSAEEVFDEPTRYTIRGPLEYPPMRTYQWIAAWPGGVIAEPGTPPTLTELAEDVFERWLAE